MKIITEEMRFRKRLCEFALKNGLEKSRFGILVFLIASGCILCYYIYLLRRKKEYEFF